MQKRIKLDTRTFSCVICLDLLTDPVTISCGHSYCRVCIQTHFDGEARTQSCPECRWLHRPMYALGKNTMLAALVEELKKPGEAAPAAAVCYAGPKNVACDVCTGRKMKAVKSCLTCLASYCEEHLKPHHESPVFKKHKLVAPSKKLQGDIQQKIKAREKDLKVLQQEVEGINRSANTAVKDSEKIFTELMHLMEKKRSDVKQQVRDQQKSEVSRVKELQEKLKQEIAELKRKASELEQLSHAEDRNKFPNDYPSLSPLSESVELPSTKIVPLRYFDDVTVAVSELRDKLLDGLSEKWTNISRTLLDVDVLLPQPEPKTRAEFLKYSRELTMDPNTAFKRLSISEGDRRAMVESKEESYSNPAFKGWSQVLSKETLTGHCYWEVDWSAMGVHVAVAYKNSGKGKNFSFGEYGMKEKSWAVLCDEDSYHFWCNNEQKPKKIPVQRYPRVGVYLDQKEGLLSFYMVSDTMTLLHRVKTTFTRPLYASIWICNYPGNAVGFCKLK